MAGDAARKSLERVVAGRAGASSVPVKLQLHRDQPVGGVAYPDNLLRGWRGLVRGDDQVALREYTRRKCFISYHHADEDEVQAFITAFDHDHDVLIARGIGASMSGDIINSINAEYIMARIREKYLRDTTVTIAMVGQCTWSRKFVDWELAASLRNTASYNRNGLMAITLPSAADYWNKQLPARINDNIDGEDGYARWWKYPTSTSGLANMIETAYEYRTSRSHLVENARALRPFNATC